MKIQTYKQEVRQANIRKLFFWFIVFIITTFMYFFFQGYYIDTKMLFQDRENFFDKPRDYIKPFGVIELNLLPEADNLSINNIGYPTASLRNIFDYGNYDISMSKEGYYPVDLKISLNRDLQYYSNNIYLVKNTVLNKLSYLTSRIEKLNNDYLFKTSSGYFLLDSNLEFKNKFTISYDYLGYNYFSNEGKIYYYDSSNNLIVPYLDTNTQEQIICKNPKIIRTEVFCNDNSKFLTFNNINIKEKVLKINRDLIFTKNNIYNLETGKSYKYLSGTHLEENSNSIVYIKQKQYILKDSKFINLTALLETGIYKYLKLDGFDTIDYAKNFGNDALIVGKKDGKYKALLKDSIHEYVLDLSFVDDIEGFNIINEKGVYIIKSPKNVYIYYKGGSLIKVADDAQILKVFAGYIFLNKDNETYYINLFQD
ncbi:MAG: hypothetical protein PHR68_00620 [Candidatus Gracilibacteria bacterium]|nr:hypothetical protein [Candidatus Gracilibacteria bacterium]